MKFLAEQALCYWLMELFASHLNEISTDHGLATLKLERIANGAKVTIDNCDEIVLAVQDIPCMNFPLDEITLFACWNGQFWVIMLTSEY